MTLALFTPEWSAELLRDAEALAAGLEDAPPDVAALSLRLFREVRRMAESVQEYAEVVQDAPVDLPEDPGEPRSLGAQARDLACSIAGSVHEARTADDQPGRVERLEAAAGHAAEVARMVRAAGLDGDEGMTV